MLLTFLKHERTSVEVVVSPLIGHRFNLRLTETETVHRRTAMRYALPLVKSPNILYYQTSCHDQKYDRVTFVVPRITVVFHRLYKTAGDVIHMKGTNLSHSHTRAKKTY
jgi:hypothetical protein